MNHSFSWRQLASVQIGGAICLPTILIGYELSRIYGAGTALVGIAIGNFLLLCLALISAKMSAENKQTTSENAGNYFGQFGKKFIACMLTCSMCGWFAIQTQMISHDLAGSLFSGDPTLILSIIFAASLLFGLKGITKLADMSVPLLVLTLIVALVAAYGQAPVIESVLEPVDLINGGCISLVMALAIGVVIDMPTFFRHAASKKEALLGSVATFLIGVPAIEVSGVLLQKWSSSSTLIGALGSLQNPLWSVWISLFLFFAAWTTNTTNLYSAAMGLSTLFPKISSRKIFVMTSAFAVAISSFDLISRLTIALDIMGVCIASAVGVILVAYSSGKSGSGWSRNVAFAAGAIVGVTVTVIEGIQLTGAPVLDAVAISALSLFCIEKMGMEQRKVTYEQQ